MATDMAVLGALVATQNLSFDDAKSIETFLDFVDDVNVDVPDLAAGIDLALDFFNDEPDVEAEAVAERVRAAHEHDDDTCPDCGGPMSGGMDDVDFDMACDLWIAVRGMVDKFAFDQMHSHGDERGEC